ncbi:hypothetical protein G7074_11850 [Pedobacter sp. HDW13]|uniref:hypothetical protein n=1 Tax=unclassified Pedobacter TaxID=2628915 RepID=UPI000F599CA6|nr:MULTISPECIES: hypothetical protein [unclassified Pedobacter]QIL39898.1 hypothetical protein G7074_11850 [Pedobacter sp. HDW13]RQO79611.1 hypothetical protein DBR40_01230 [Pedobacter sp. KBW01]
MKKIILTGAIVVSLGSALSLQSCNNEKKIETTTDTTIVKTTDTMVVDSTKVMSSSKMKDSTDTGGRNGQAPPPKK